MKFYVASAAVLLLGACAKPYVGTPYTPTATPLTEIGLADDSLPDEVIAQEVASVGSNFGLIGALVDSGVQASRKKRVNDALETVDFDPEPKFEQYLMEDFAGQNINTVLVEGPDREKREFLTDYPGAPEGTQAYLDVNVVAFGYVNAGSQSWRPSVFVDVKLVDVDTGDVLLENRIASNPVNPQQGVITLFPNPEYVFQNREDMISQPERLAEGLDDALKTVADSIAKLVQ